MNWSVTPWLKLYRNPDPDWVRLPLSARGLGDESLKYARPDDGFLVDGAGEHPGVELSCLMSARPDEHGRIKVDVDRLLAHGFLELRGTKVFVRNYVEAQARQSPAAIRKARQRARAKAAQETARDAERDMSRGQSQADRHAMSQRNETIRSETKRSDPSPPSPASSQAPDPASAAVVRGWKAAMGSEPQGDLHELAELVHALALKAGLAPECVAESAVRGLRRVIAAWPSESARRAKPTPPLLVKHWQSATEKLIADARRDAEARGYAEYSQSLRNSTALDDEARAGLAALKAVVQ